MSDFPPIPRPSLGPNQRWWIGLACTYLVFFLLMDAKLWRPGVYCDAAVNTQVIEAQQWWQGKLDLPERLHDTALCNGKVYSHFPLLFTFLAFPFVKFASGIPHPVLVLLIALPLPALAYVLLERVTKSVAWGVVLAVGFIVGTSEWPVLHRALRGCEPYFVNHGLATIGLFIFLGEFFGRKRVGVAGTGLIISAWTRPMTAMFVLSLAWMTMAVEPAMRKRRLGTLGVVCALIWGGPMVVSFLKYGNPFESGYMLIYEGRDDYFATDAREHGLFSTAFLKRNLYWHNIGLPERHWIEVEGKREFHVTSNMVCTGLWWTTPVMLWLFAALPPILRDPARRWLLATVVLVFGGLMLFHAAGNVQRGYNRFSLDYLPALMAVVAPHAVAGWRRWVTLALVAWSVVYFVNIA